MHVIVFFLVYCTANVVIRKIKSFLHLTEKKKKTHLPIFFFFFYFYQVSTWFVRQMISKELCIKNTQILRLVEEKMVSEKVALENSNKGVANCDTASCYVKQMQDHLEDFQII